MKLATQMSRYSEIGRVLARHGWHSALGYLGIERLSRDREVPAERAHELLPPSAVRRILADLGPTYVKIGQILSTRPDLVPDPYVKELEKLQDQAAPVAVEEIRAALEEAFGKPVEEVFDEFDPEPLAAASISQVHTAVYQGRRVAVKVQRPGIERTIEADFVILRSLAQHLEATWPLARRHDLGGLTSDLHDYIRQELDFAQEGRNADRLRASVGSRPSIHVPRVEWSLTTSRVLVTELLVGAKITDDEGLERLGADRSRLARTLAETMLHQIFVSGVFHGDPHPGNVLALADGSIGLLDLGNVPTLTPRTRELVLSMFLSLHRQDSASFSDALSDLAGADDTVDRRSFVRDVDRILHEYQTASATEGRIGRVLRRAMSLVLRHGLRLSGEVGVLAKACVQFEGICRKLDPTFEVLDLVDGLLVRSALHGLNPTAVTAATLASANDVWKLAQVAPRSLSQILMKLAHGQFATTVQHAGLDEFGEHLDKVANRLAYSLVVSGSIVGSSILVQAEVGPKVLGVSLVGIISFAVSGLLGGVLLWNILTSGRLK